MKTTSRCVTKSRPLEPEKPVRYRMFARLVTSSPSMWAAVRPSASAARRLGRESDTRRQRTQETAQRQLVAIRAKSAHHADCRRSEHRLATLRLARIDVRDVYFNIWDGHTDK